MTDKITEAAKAAGGTTYTNRHYPDAPAAPAKRPPNARGQGRKPTPEGPRRSTSIRLTDEQHQKLARLGGAEWFRVQIDKAKEPKT